MPIKTMAIGNSPSSGSTFLADLLDSTPHTACGPETNLFSINTLYRFDTFRENMKKSTACPAVYFDRNILNFNDLCAYGLNEKKLGELLDRSSTLTEFLNCFAVHYLTLRDTYLYR